MTSITMLNATASGPKHLAGVKGAVTLNTPGLRSIRNCITQLVEVGGIIPIDGKPGVGKTFGTQEVLSGLDIRVHWADMPDTPKGKEATARIYSAVTGRRPTHRMTEYELTEETVDALQDLQGVLVIDEAQNMTVSAMRALRYLHDRPSTQVLFLLLGSGVLDTVRAVPELDSRVSRRAIIKEISGEKLVPLLQELHPILAATKQECLVELAGYAKGNLRNWARILEVAMNFGVEFENGITRDHVKHIIRGITGGSR